jgi:hypothetical protein
VGLTSQLVVGVTTLEDVEDVCCCCSVGLGTRTDTQKNTAHSVGDRGGMREERLARHGQGVG